MNKRGNKPAIPGATVGFAMLIAATAIAIGCQHGPEPKLANDTSPCFTGDGGNALTIALPTDAGKHIDGIYIRRKGCQQWSQNLGVVLPGKSIHIFKLDNGEMEIFWRTKPHTFGLQPQLTESPPTRDEWSTANGKKTMTLTGETHRRIVVS